MPAVVAGVGVVVVEESAHTQTFGEVTPLNVILSTQEFTGGVVDIGAAFQHSVIVL